MTETEKRQAYWRGVVFGALWAFGCSVSLCVTGYCFLQIVKEFQ